jgi:asparagine synthase (glutamine-hydrolysing)
MPGIVGLITKMPREWAEPQLIKMVQSLRHESFYESGTWVDETLGVYVGWTALKNSFAAAMPLRNEKEDVALVFSGEDFPGATTVLDLKKRGHAVDTVGPSYLVHLYEENPSFPVGLNGRFHGLVTDRKCGTTMLFNDRYGMHRIYYHESKDAFYFAAEAKAILAVRPQLRRPDQKGLGELVACGCVLENRTIFKDVHVLPPASAWTFRGGTIQTEGVYFNPSEWENQPPMEQESHYEQSRDIFSRNLPRYFRSEERLGMSLTGGLDTRMIMAWQNSSPGSLPCYSFGSSYRDCQDVVLARKIARACGQPHEVIPLGDEFLSRFPHYAERTVYLTDGCVDVSHAPDLYINEKARTIAPIRMTGNYGGEVLRRVRAFKPVELASGLFRPEFLSHVHSARDSYSRTIQTHALSFAVFRQAPWHHHGLLSLEQTQLSLRSPFLDNDFVRTLYQAPESVCVNSDLSLRLIADGNADLLRIRTDRGLTARNKGLVRMAVRGFMQFTTKAEYAYDYGMPQWMAHVDHALSPFRLERLFLGRHKFYHFRVWYRDALSTYIQEMLLDPRTLSRPYLERSRLETMIRGHLNGGCNYTTEIHKVLTLELIHRHFFDPR